MKYILSLLLSFSTMIAMAQFVDIEWTPTDTVPPYYSESYEMGEDYSRYDCQFVMEYVETQPATKEELRRYKVNADELTEDFAVTTSVGVVRKQGRFDVTVVPFALREGKVVKLTSFKPVFSKTLRAEAQSRVATRATVERYAANSRLATGRWVKIRVSAEGVYELTKAQLSSMGFSNPDRVRLYGYNVPLLPEGNIEHIPDDMQEIPLWRKSNGNLLFYSCGLTRWVRVNNTRNLDHIHTNNPYSTYVSYFITDSGEGNPATFPTVQTDATESVATSIGVGHALIDNDEFSFINTGRTFFEEYDFANGSTRNYTLPMPGKATNKVNLAVQFAAAGSNSSSLKVIINGAAARTMYFEAVSKYIYGDVRSINRNLQDVSGDNPVITLEHSRASGISGHLDYIRAAYERHLSLAGVNALPFGVIENNKNSYRISGANASTRLWHVGSADIRNNTVYNVAGTLEAGGVYVATDGPSSGRISNERYLALNVDASYPQPEVVGEIGNQNLHATAPVDLVIIVPANGHLTKHAQRLADAHTAREGMRCMVVTADKVYNEFSSGMPDATAYRRFMKMLYDRASSEADMPKNLLLFGPGMWDNRFVTSKMKGRSQDDFLLCYESVNSVSHTHSYILEDYFALLDDGEGVSPLKDKMDIGVGRIPVTSSVEAAKVVDKLITYINNEEVGSWKNTICMLGDDGDENMHMNDAEEVLQATEAAFPTYRYRRIYWDAYKLENTATGASFPAAYADINKQMDDGALIMNYTGHGAAYCLSHEKVLMRTDFERWNSPRLPLWITAACDVSPFDMNETNIGESALYNPKGAAMGVVTTTRTVYSTQNRALNRNFMRHVLGSKADGRRITLGEALQLAKVDIVTAGMAELDSINKCHFVLLGDPAITLATPKYNIVVDEFNGAASSSETSPMINAGSVVSVRGHVVDESGNVAEGFSGLVSPSVFDNLEKVVCYNGSGQDVDAPMQYYERLGLIYSGTDSVRNGRFEFRFPVPLDINYSDESGLLRLYAVNSDHSVEVHGNYDRFLVGGTSPSLSTDKEGPQISLYLNNDSFQPGGKVNISPLFVATLYDEDGINTTGSGVGHDLYLVIDNDPQQSYTLNSYYQQEPGDYVKGTVTYKIPDLTPGSHTLTFRAWDVLNNSSTVTVPFEVEAGLSPTLFSFHCQSPVRTTAKFTIVTDRAQSEMRAEVSVYDMTGREVARLQQTEDSRTDTYTFTWDLNTSNAHLQPGIYICKATLIDTGGGRAEQTQKILVLAQ